METKKLSEEQRTPPKSAKNNAKKALRWREEYPEEIRGGTRVGWTRANQIASGSPLSEDVIKRMAQFNRHRENSDIDPKFKNEPWRDAGHVAWLLWGGTTGVDWAIRQSERITNNKSNKMEKKQLLIPFDVKNNLNTEGDENFYKIEGYASTFDNIDRGGDIVIRGAFKECLREKETFPLLWQHDMSEPVGSFKAKEVKEGLYLEGIMPKNDSLVETRVMPQIKAGSIQALSIGYSVLDSDYTKEGNRMLKKIDLWETSLVTVPMNPEAILTSVKSFMDDVEVKASQANTRLPLADRERDWDGEAAVNRVREYTESQEEPSSAYKRFFMYFDPENEDNFGGYKLPFVDIIDGEPHIVPKAVFAIAGGRGVQRADIPETDKESIIGKVNELYKRMSKEFEDEDLVSPFEQRKKSIEEMTTIKDAEMMLKDLGLSNNESKTFISKFKEINQPKRDVEVEEKRDASKDKITKELNSLISNYINELQG